MKKSIMISSMIGKKVKIYRKLSNISQKDLAEKLGISFQQVQKYEKGTNRISIDSLIEIAEILGISYHQFFEGVVDGNRNEVCAPNKAHTQESLDLLKHYYRLSDKARFHLQAFLKEI